MEIGTDFINKELLTLLDDDSRVQAEIDVKKWHATPAQLRRLKTKRDKLRQRIATAVALFHLAFVRFLLETFTKLIIPKSGVQGQIMKRKWNAGLKAYVERNIGRRVAAGIQLFSWAKLLRLLEEQVALPLTRALIVASVCIAHLREITLAQVGHTGGLVQIWYTSEAYSTKLCLGCSRLYNVGTSKEFVCTRSDDDDDDDSGAHDAAGGQWIPWRCCRHDCVIGRDLKAGACSVPCSPCSFSARVQELLTLVLHAGEVIWVYRLRATECDKQLAYYDGNRALFEHLAEPAVGTTATGASGGAAGGRTQRATKRGSRRGRPRRSASASARGGARQSGSRPTTPLPTARRASSRDRRRRSPAEWSPSGSEVEDDDLDDDDDDDEYVSSAATRARRPAGSTPCKFPFPSLAP